MLRALINDNGLGVVAQSDMAGINLAGVKRIIELERTLESLQEQVAALTEELAAAYQRIAELEALSAFPRRDLLPAARSSTEVVLYRRRA